MRRKRRSTMPRGRLIMNDLTLVLIVWLALVGASLFLILIGLTQGPRRYRRK